MGNNEFDKLIKSKIQNYQEPFDSKEWELFQDKVAEKSSKRGGFLAWLSLAGLVVIGVSSVLYMYDNGSSDKDPIAVNSEVILETSSKIKPLLEGTVAHPQSGLTPVSIETKNHGTQSNVILSSTSNKNVEQRNRSSITRGNTIGLNGINSGSVNHQNDSHRTNKSGESANITQVRIALNNNDREVSNEKTLVASVFKNRVIKKWALRNASLLNPDSVYHFDLPQLDEKIENPNLIGKKLNPIPPHSPHYRSKKFVSMYLGAKAAQVSGADITPGYSLGGNFEYQLIPRVSFVTGLGASGYHFKNNNVPSVDDIESGNAININKSVDFWTLQIPLGFSTDVYLGSGFQVYALSKATIHLNLLSKYKFVNAETNSSSSFKGFEIENDFQKSKLGQFVGYDGNSNYVSLDLGVGFRSNLNNYGASWFVEPVISLPLTEFGGQKMTTLGLNGGLRFNLK